MLLLQLQFQNKLMCFCLFKLKTCMPYMNTHRHTHTLSHTSKLGRIIQYMYCTIKHLPISAPMSDLSLFSSMLPCRSSSFSKGVKRLRSPRARFSLMNSSLLPSLTIPTFYDQRSNIKKEVLPFVNALS